MASRATWLDAFRLGGGIVSLVGALAVALVIQDRLSPDAAPRAMTGLVVVGLVGFSAGMLALGRDVARRWLAFGAGLGFTPATRRPFLDFGTDRPTLYGRVGDHALRMRLVVMRAREGTREWLELETDILCDDVELAAERARAAIAELRARGLHVLHADAADGRLRILAPFPEGDASSLMQAVARVADRVARPA